MVPHYYIADTKAEKGFVELTESEWYTTGCEK